jgi:hypothetical protein
VEISHCTFEDFTVRPQSGPLQARDHGKLADIQGIGKVLRWGVHRDGNFGPLERLGSPVLDHLVDGIALSIREADVTPNVGRDEDFRNGIRPSAA